VKLDIKLSDIKDKLPELAEEIFKSLSFGVGRNNDTEVSSELFNSETWNLEVFTEYPELKSKAQRQLGTIGSGNHYVDVFSDEEDNIWVGVHFGSRGLGHTIASHYMKLAGDNLNIMDETPHTLDVNSKDGQDYLKAMELAGEYAYAGRDWVCETVTNILGGKVIDEVHNHHNFAWKEEHNGETFYVVRKGATPAFPNQRGFVGSSMGDNSVIIRGVDSEESRSLFYSTVHGAGRVMSRTQAAGKSRWIKGKKTKISEGEVDFGSVKERIKSQGTILKGAGADEAPEVYKKLTDVLEYHKDTIEILHTLRPLIVCMAGEDEFDPYKD
jgi:tRNA-splicing ligase RtcB